MEIRSCLQCGKTLDEKHEKFCSRICANRYKGEHERKYKICKNCGKPFYKKSNWGVVFCSDSCRNEFNWKNKSEKQRIKEEKRMQYMHTVCKVCGREFEAKNGNQKICSEECKKRHANEKALFYQKKKYVPKHFFCKMCGKEVNTKYGDKNLLFCSKECSKRFSRRENYKNKKRKIAKRVALRIREKLVSKNYIEPVSVKKLLARDGAICKICGLPLVDDDKKYWDTTIDHIVPLTKKGEHSVRNCQLTHRI